MSDALVTVASYWSVPDAILAQHALSAAGIESYVEDEHMAVNYPQAVQGVKLRVRNVDALRAAEVLETTCEALEEIGEADERFPDPNTCPACGSHEIVRAPRGLLFATIAALALGIGLAFQHSDSAFFAVLATALLLIMWDRQRCAECGESWN